MLNTEIKITADVAAQHGLSPEEFARIRQILGRDPNLTELGIFSVMWSEHCSYKSSKIHLRRLPTHGPHVLQGPGENAGVVDIGDGLAAVFKIESHNHPSFVEPFQGAATGVGGILRDIFTMGARPIAVLDSLRFGPLQPTSPTERSPEELARNRRILDGVVSGIAFYGNCFGVPTVGGEVQFEPCYSSNPLVNVLALGIARGVVGALFFYFFEAARGFERAETSILLLVYFVFGLFGAPAWSWLAVRLGKHKALIWACVYFAVTLMFAAFLAPVLVEPTRSALEAMTGNPAPYADLLMAGAMVALVGLAFASGDLLLRAMMADVSDQVRLDDGADRTGLLFSILTATSKLGYAVSVLTFAGLQMAGFDPGLGGQNSGPALMWLQIMFAGLPALCLLLAAVALHRYPLDQARHAEIRAALDAKAQG